MKITAGMGSIDEYPAFAQAGTDEVFCGYVPLGWMERYGMATPLNRREVRYVNVQLGSESELMILSDMREKYGVPVTLTFNALSFRPEQYPMVAEIMQRCAALGFSRFIVADPALLVYLHAQGLSDKFSLYVSGELGAMNTGVAELCAGIGARRIIFHRKMTPADMAACIRQQPGMEFEAFALNEMCHFHGGFCNSLHCDELDHVCLLPYRLGAVRGEGGLTLPGERETGDVTGAGGCGLCTLSRLERIGVTHLKLVSRGALAENTLRDIAALRTALDILADSRDEAQYQREMKRMLFPQGCSGNCYYRGTG